MADFAPAINAIRECCLGAVGSVRVVPPGDVAERAYPSTVEHEAARALTGPRFEVTIVRAEPSKDSPWEHSPVRLELYTVQIRTEFTTAHELIDAARASAQSEAWNLLNTCRAALMRGGNLLTTADSTATGIVSGCLHRFISHDLERADWQRRRLSYLSRYQTQIQFSQTPG